MSTEVVNIARCPEHGLHGERQECFVCGGEVEQVPMIHAAALVPVIQEQERLRAELRDASAAMSAAAAMLTPRMRAGTAEAKALLERQMVDVAEACQHER
jgi:hypothetical protein